MYAPAYEVNPFGVVRHRGSHVPAPRNIGNGGHVYVRLDSWAAVAEEEEEEEEEEDDDEAAVAAAAEDGGDGDEAAPPAAALVVGRGGAAGGWGGGLPVVGWPRYRKLAVRNLVALAHLDGAAAALKMTAEGTQVRGGRRRGGARGGGGANGGGNKKGLGGGQPRKDTGDVPLMLLLYLYV
ncbi:hypothetical protein VOLCADRAFT_89461 [Volvox carteri f. nagariensis]|uniref:Uncharacterized protein n=1 Tax=Volvox carteri f. nagariensis TaxID=3068 RepID=D8TRW6_VOLCA|nr:uncharacterized protein VOLCADRAFT_89461 [Volvox carteri f. nagariensis]EFJ49594.1 hypothetical protein VOLCADRAFT_89461 [Volvox carteri f. nagariensis]|eukprot:XP_002949101.1 hypothetical protein VOLCADRAFT_89461 [Volvox carteri f. nagariensis]